MKDMFKLGLLSITALAVITGLLFYFGVIGNLFNSTVGKQHIDIQRENFEHSKSYVHGKIEDLAQYKREYQRAKTPEEKEQVRNYILDEFATFDKNYIDNADLYNFLIEMENGN